jgi:hypothetical protein
MKQLNWSQVAAPRNTVKCHHWHICGFATWYHYSVTRHLKIWHGHYEKADNHMPSIATRQGNHRRPSCRLLQPARRYVAGERARILASSPVGYSLTRKLAATKSGKVKAYFLLFLDKRNILLSKRYQLHPASAITHHPNTTTDTRS